jgi:tetratricopeptide (TPR) repeat protein
MSDAGHLSNDELIRHLERPTQEEIDHVNEHVAWCRECEERMAALAGEVRPEPCVPQPEGFPSIPGYRIEKEVGRGGMGVVYRATHLRLGREVALKLVLAAGLSSIEDLRRFRDEARVVASLNHPNIVQLYEDGEADGVPFFSMELIEGGTLASALARSPVPFRSEDAARLVAKIARAVHFAHQHGVLHRDLKPANILLDAAGEPHVTDFGLARRLAADASLAPSGAVVGTPNYMPPEQARGQRVLTTAADVYSLGAILFELLTRRPPFRADTTLDTLFQVIEQEAPSPRSINPAVERDLETICLKCLRKEPAQRYQSAADLAADLERFVNGEPIQARSVHFLERTWRWCWRHPAVALPSAAAAVLLLLLTAGSLYGIYTVSAANTGLQSARETADRNATRARLGFDLASESMEQTVQRIAENERLKDRGFFELRKELLAPVVRFYADLARLKSDDPQLEANRGRAHGKLARVRLMLGETEQAAADYREMRAIFQSLCDAQPEEPAYQLELATANQELAAVLFTLAHHEESTAVFAEAEKLAEDLVTRHPGVVAYHDRWLAIHVARADQLFGTGHIEDALPAYQEAVRLAEERGRLFPATRESRRELANLRGNLGATYLRLEKWEEALPVVTASHDLWRELVAEVPTDAMAQEGLAHSWTRLGQVYWRLGREEAEVAYQEAVRVARGVTAVFPALPSAREQLAVSCHNRAVWLAKHERHEEATALYQESTAILEKLAAEFPPVSQHTHDLGMNYIARGQQHLLSSPETALYFADKAVAVLAEGVKADPRLDDMGNALARASVLRASSLSGLHRFDEAVRACDLAVALYPPAAKHSELTQARFWASWAARQQLVPALRLAQQGKHVEASTLANAMVEAPRLAALRPLAATDALSGVCALAVASNVAGREGAVGDTLYNAACVFTRCATLVENDSPDLAETYTRRAFGLLLRARDEGYFATAEGRKLLESDADLKRLRGRPDFEALRAAPLAAHR